MFWLLSVPLEPVKFHFENSYTSSNCNIASENIDRQVISEPTVPWKGAEYIKESKTFGKEGVKARK